MLYDIFYVILSNDNVSAYFYDLLGYLECDNDIYLVFYYNYTVKS